ncbi:TPR-like protein [Basidiobolus meristosporus CBS 931.73]|uniref:ER membrane protein complex subunit 2 n=1 Tax=Basidiobolus meristosporus CBS 931.73 TaxID=1314790 RepID=A0A1Y1Z856_9FUNG|nr:TPR-like protein [Basidiobolus meristosporus CBS 931.73]|eukprot:ORY06442.1 TPR-like protein [Basidiobolus meristosporus CBS 931.73]
MVSFDYNTAYARLHDLNLTGERRPDVVVELGEKILFGGYARQLGDEVWGVYEQVLIAALDEGRFDLAKACLDKLQARFSKSHRVQRLQGMSLEAEGKLDEAYNLYSDILTEDPTNIMAVKRQIAIQKARGSTIEAIQSLSKYLDIHFNDIEAWLELCELYLDQFMYQQAAFCLEEVILLQPLNHLFHLKYAEVLFTMDNVAMALKEFCHVIELCTDHTRGLYGIKACTTRLLKPGPGSSRNSTGNTKRLSELDIMASERILELYSKSKGDASSQMKKVIEAWLTSQ